MISNKKWQQLLALATTGEKLPNDATEEEKEAYESLVRDHKIMLETAEKHGINNPEMYIPCLLYTSPSPRDRISSRMPSSA